MMMIISSGGSQSPLSAPMRLSIGRHSFCTTSRISSHSTFVLSVHFLFLTPGIYTNGIFNNLKKLIVIGSTVHHPLFSADARELEPAPNTTVRPRVYRPGVQEVFPPALSSPVLTNCPQVGVVNRSRSRDVLIFGNYV